MSILKVVEMWFAAFAVRWPILVGVCGGGRHKLRSELRRQVFKLPNNARRHTQTHTPHTRTHRGNAKNINQPWQRQKSFA